MIGVTMRERDAAHRVIAALLEEAVQRARSSELSDEDIVTGLLEEFFDQRTSS